MAITRRTALGAMAAAPLLAGCAHLPSTRGWDAIVVGAGVFGAWTATALQAAGQKVLLVDAWGPAHARASSGGESRLTRAGYGSDAIYSRMSRESLEDWKRLSQDANLPLFHPTGVLNLFRDDNPYTSHATGGEAVLKDLGIPLERLTPAQVAARFPQVNAGDVSFGQFEPDFGVLMARRSVMTLVQAFLAQGGAYAQTAILPPQPGEALRTPQGDTLEGTAYVFACGPWLAKLFPGLLAEKLFATRQEIFFFGPPEGATRFGPATMPGWTDFTQEAVHYGFPDLEGRGFKIANDDHGPLVDFDANDRLVTPEGLAGVRAFMAHRFPALASAPLSESRVCQYENSATGDFLIDRHPAWKNAVLVGMGSGHGFKHGPAVGRRAAALVTGNGAPESRFTLASKADRQQRSVH